MSCKPYSERLRLPRYRDQTAQSSVVKPNTTGLKTNKQKQNHQKKCHDKVTPNNRWKKKSRDSQLDDQQRIRDLGTLNCK